MNNSFKIIFVSTTEQKNSVLIIIICTYFPLIDFQNAVNSRPMQINLTITNNIYFNHTGQRVSSNDNTANPNGTNINMDNNNLDEEHQEDDNNNNGNQSDQDDNTNVSEADILTPSTSDDNTNDHAQ